MTTSRSLTRSLASFFLRLKVGAEHDTASVWTTCVRLAHRHRARPAFVRHAFTAANEGDADLPPDRNLRAVQLLLGHTKIESTVRYLGIDVDDALAIAEQVDV